MVLIKEENKKSVVMGVWIGTLIIISLATVGVMDTVIIFVFGTFLGCAILLMLILGDLMEV